MHIIPIHIDTQDLANKFNISSKQVEDICDNVAKTLASRYANTLEKTAQRELNQTRSRYIKNIRLIDTGRLEGTVMLDYSKDKLIKMIEEGADPFDMKKGFLDSSKVKTTKSGKKYLTIPFRWSTPSAIGEADVFSGAMPTEVYNAVRKMSQNIPVSGGGMRTAGLDATTLSAPLSLPQTRQEIQDSRGKILFKEYEHKTSIYQGITQQKDSVTGQNRYFSFRRVSENSDPDAFIHSGIEQYNLIKKALNNFDQATELSHALDIEWSKLGF